MSPPVRGAPTCLAIVSSDEKSPRGKVVFLNEFHPGHEAGDADVVGVVLARETHNVA